MAKTLIGNIKGKNGRGITSIKKTGTTGSVDTYTITYTDGTTSTFTVNNSDSISLQRQIVSSAAVESSTTASQAYMSGDYVVVNGVLRLVIRAIAKGNTINNSNSEARTLTDSIKNSAYRAMKAEAAVNNVAKMFVGTVVSTVNSSSTASGHEARLFTKEEFKANFGRPFDASKDYIGVMNADGSAANTYLNSVTYFGGSGNIWVGVPGVSDGNTIRLNYLVILGA